MARTSKKRLPEGPFYRDLGNNLRLARNTAGKSQEDAAEHIDVTFQQLQKYESGHNRIPIDRLVSLADFLDVPVSHFIGETGSGDNADFQALVEQSSSKEFRTLLKFWIRLKDPHLRAAIVDFVKRMAVSSD